MPLIPLSAVVVNRDNRQRKELTNLEGLAASIARRGGLIHPIVLREGNELVAGERRLAAHKLLGWDQIEYRLWEDLTDTQAYAIELEENIKREALPWKDECYAVWAYHQLRCTEDPSHEQKDTAGELALSTSSVSDRLMVQEELLRGNELVAEADKYSVAKNITVRQRERAKAAEAEDIMALISPDEKVGADPLKAATAGLIILDEASTVTPEQFDYVQRKQAPLLLADFTEWAPTYSGPRFNFIHCDFPYGVNADKHHQGAAKYFRGYADSPDIYWQLVATLGDNIERLCADSAHLMFWFSMDYYTETRLALEQMGWRVNPFPLIWYKSDNTGILPDPQRGPRRIYETAFLAARGDRKIVQPVANVFPAPVTKTVHMSEKSTPMLRHFFRMLVDSHTIMLDPTCGSASAVKAAQAAGAKSVLGLERDPEFYERAVDAWEETEVELELDL